MELDPKIWGNLPEVLIDKICNMNTNLIDEIKFQPHKYARWYYNCVGLFGINNAYTVMYDDMRHILNVLDTYSEDTPYETVVENMWRGLTPEDRDEIIITY
jgi:hypothetical protein